MDSRYYTNMNKYQNNWLHPPDPTLFSQRNPHGGLNQRNQTPRSDEHSNETKLPTIIRKSATAYSPVDNADKADIT